MTPEQIDHIVHAYAYTMADRDKLTALMADAYLAAREQAYHRAHTTAGRHVSFVPRKSGHEDTEKARAWAAPRAESIAETYEGLLRSRLEQMQENTPHEAISDMWGGISGFFQQVGDWFANFLGWKCEQIADDTISEGENDGTEDFVGDTIKSGDDYSMLKVQVLPEESSSDFCAEYAGRIFPFDAVGSECPEFPAHSRCIHSLVVLAPDESEDEG